MNPEKKVLSSAFCWFKNCYHRPYMWAFYSPIWQHLMDEHARAAPTHHSAPVGVWHLLLLLRLLRLNSLYRFFEEPLGVTAHPLLGQVVKEQGSIV